MGVTRPNRAPCCCLCCEPVAKEDQQATSSVLIRARREECIDGAGEGGRHVWEGGWANKEHGGGVPSPPNLLCLLGHIWLSLIAASATVSSLFLEHSFLPGKNPPLPAKLRPHLPSLKAYHCLGSRKLSLSACTPLSKVRSLAPNTLPHRLSSPSPFQNSRLPTPALVPLPHLPYTFQVFAFSFPLPFWSYSLCTETYLSCHLRGFEIGPEKCAEPISRYFLLISHSQTS